MAVTREQYNEALERAGGKLRAEKEAQLGNSELARAGADLLAEKNAQFAAPPSVQAPALTGDSYAAALARHRGETRQLETLDRNGEQSRGPAAQRGQLFGLEPNMSREPIMSGGPPPEQPPMGPPAPPPQAAPPPQQGWREAFHSMDMRDRLNPVKALSQIGGHIDQHTDTGQAVNATLGLGPHQFAAGLRAQKERGDAPPAEAAGGAVFAPDPQQGGAPSTWGGGGGGYVAPHMGVTSRSTQKGIEFSPETMAAQQGMAEHGKNAIGYGAAAEMQQRDQAYQGQEAENAYAHGERAMQHINEGRRGIEQFHAEQEVRDKKSELAETPATVPEYFSKLKTGDKVINLIGLALGGVDLMGNRGGRNSFLDGIQNNIAAQMGKKGHELDFAEKGVKTLEGKHDKARMLEAQKYRDGLDAVKMEMHAQALKSGDPAVMARAEAQSSALDKELLQVDMHLDEAKQDKVVEHESMTGGSGGAGAAASMHLVDMPGGDTYSFATEDDRKKVQERVLAQQDLDNIYSQVKAIRSTIKPADKFTSPIEYYKKISELDSLAEKALPAWSTSKGQGQVKDAEAERYKKNLFPFSQIWDPAANKILENGLRENAQSVPNIVMAHRGERVNSAYGRGPGGIKPTAAYAGEHASPAPIQRAGGPARPPMAKP